METPQIGTVAEVDRGFDRHCGFLYDLAFLWCWPFLLAERAFKPCLSFLAGGQSNVWDIQVRWRRKGNPSR